MGLRGVVALSRDFRLYSRFLRITHSLASVACGNSCYFLIHSFF